MCDNGRIAVRLLQRYLIELQYMPKINRDSLAFQTRSYQRSAVIDMLECFKFNDKTPQLDILEKYRRKMIDYACKSPTCESNYMFSVKADTATYIIDETISHIQDERRTKYGQGKFHKNVPKRENRRIKA